LLAVRAATGEGDDDGKQRRCCFSLHFRRTSLHDAGIGGRVIA
jgi:hypothetical protein